MKDDSARRVSARKLWFQVHKWIGIMLAVLIVPISLTGSALVWHDWLDETLNPQRHAAAPASLSRFHFSPFPLSRPAGRIIEYAT